MAVSWREIQRQNFTKWKEFLEFLGLEPSSLSSSFPLNVPKRLASKINKKDPEDPIFLQFALREEEQVKSPLFVLDPVQDGASQKTKKLLHKYQGRALLVATSACAMHCRYCFRQHFPYETGEKSFEEELTYIQATPSLEEVLLSGGDPLSLSDAALKSLIESLDKIPHLKRLRFHTRFPIGIPERITEEFLSILKETRLQVVFVIHTNHAQELDEEIFAALKKIQRLGIPVLSQSVLLKGVNDTTRALSSLFLTLIDHGILPYYLHQLDRVEGAIHFEVPETKGLELMEELRVILPGYALPRYVREVGGKPYKVTVQ